ncbi:MAG: dihydroorotase [Pseudomonadota bacterium]
MTSTAIRNARLVNEGRITEGDLLIRDGRIEAIGTVGAADAEFDAAGRLLLPGMIDDQVHFREPGMEYKGEIKTESAAAVAGGITSYMEMPNCNPLSINQERIDAKRARAAEVSAANYAFYLGATNDNLESIKAIDPLTVCGVKVFMGASTGNMLVDNEQTLEGIFSSTPLLIATHCEDTPMILANEAAWAERFGADIPATEHPNIRSTEACWKSSSLAVGLAKKHDARLHVLHLTTAKEMALFEPGPIAGKRITAEACVHHLFFDETWYAAKGNDIKCNPAIKKPSDREAVMAALLEDRIDVVATDHAPHTREEKDRPYPQAPAGLPLVQHALLTMFEHVHAGRMSIEKVVEKVCHAPAEIFAVRERGYLREGYWADLVCVDDGALTVVDDEPVYYKCGWSPFAGITFHSRVAATWVNGELRYDGKEVLPGACGVALEFAR